MEVVLNGSRADEELSADFRVRPTLSGEPGDLSLLRHGRPSSQLQTIQSDANDAISSARSDFPTETSAVKTNVEQLKTAVAGLPAGPSATQVAAIAVNASAVVDAAEGLHERHEVQLPVAEAG